MDKHTIIVEFPSHQNGYKLIVPIPWDKGHLSAFRLAEQALKVLESHGIRYDTVDFAAAERARDGVDPNIRLNTPPAEWYDEPSPFPDHAREGGEGE